MSNFKKYSKYYDLFYEDKNYHKEVDFLLSLAKKHKISTSKILDLGCGTGGHALEFALNGKHVHGIDLSKSMLSEANTIKNNQDKIIASKLEYSHGDIRDFSLNKKFNVIFSLFHVVSYLKNNTDLINAFKCVYKHLSKDGIFIFDFWYGPGVLWQRPSSRCKKIKKDNFIITRNAEPKIHFNNSVVDVNYHLTVKDKEDLLIEEVHELHEMRYLFINELELAAKLSGLTLIESGEWLTAKSLSENCWTAYSILQK